MNIVRASQTIPASPFFSFLFFSPSSSQPPLSPSATLVFLGYQSQMSSRVLRLSSPTSMASPTGPGSQAIAAFPSPLSRRAQLPCSKGAANKTAAAAAAAAVAFPRIFTTLRAPQSTRNRSPPAPWNQCACSAAPLGRRRRWHHHHRHRRHPHPRPHPRPRPRRCHQAEKTCRSRLMCGQVVAVS